MEVILGLFFLLISVFLEALIYLDKNIWEYKKPVSFMSSVALVLSTLILLNGNENVWLLIVGLISLYRLVNLSRLNMGRLPDKHLESISSKTFVTLALLQSIIILFWQISDLVAGFDVTAINILSILIVSGFITSVVIFISTIISLVKSHPKKAESLSDRELPTVTVAVAARNETPHLTACLNSILNDDYPKLEVLVLDDESQDNTAEIIKSFAKDGVRFVKHKDTKGDWLAKNNAYQTLLANASGEIIMFLGVDVRLHENSIRSMVEQYVARDIDMLTIIPKRTKSGLVAAFIQPMRYWWEFALPRYILKRPPALSTVWMANREKLEAIGGFNTYKRSIIPEEHLAKVFSKNNKYSYSRTTSHMQITTHKDFFRQWDTAVRTRYPHAHRRPENVMLQSASLLLLFVLPFILIWPAIFTQVFDIIYVMLILITVILYLISHVLISAITNPAAGWLAPFNFPVAIALDIYAMHVSMYKYEFSKVIWKGRDVQPHKLEVIEHLPKIDA